ncbi:retrotransposon protein, putative, ty1-copia subclass [Tanacetum coccineum]|uniref:Retrotransposon protein, putative, ty1-copia subclass n=1 Tax=Tanacetum coccineum TaxID=301880 RepID=A0ABQ5CA99_9ASTR
MKGYVEQLERLGYVLPQDLSVGLILNGLTSDFAGFVRNYNMHNIGKTIGERHVLLIEYEKGLPKKAATPQVMAIQSGRIQKSEGKLIHLEQPMTHLPYHVASQAARDAYEALNDAQNEVACLMLGRGWSVSKLLSLEDEKLTGHFGTPRLCDAKRTWCIPKKAETPVVLAIREGKIHKDKKKLQGVKGKAKGKNKLAYAPKTKIPPPLKRDNPAKDSICHHCKEVGHWRKNCPSYHAELKKRKNASEASTSESMKLKHRALSLYMGNGMRIAVEAIRSFDLILPSGLILNEVEYQLSKKIKAIRSDRGGEYLSHEFVNHMKSFGIVSQLTPPYTLQHHGVSERRNQTLLDMVRSMMNLTTLPKSFWGYALETAARILNMVSTKNVDRMPYKIWHGKVPKWSYLRVWGCYPKETMEASGSYGLLKMSGSDKGLEIIQEEDTQPSENTSKEHNEAAPIKYELGDLDEPPKYKAALVDPEFDKWLEAMNTEMQSMKDNQVWYLVDLPSNGQTVRCKWLFKKKIDMDGNVHTFKAHMVAKGYTQTYGVDYGETFSSIAYLRAIRILLAIAASWNKRFDEEINKIGFTQNPDEPCVYLKASGSNVAFLVLYVDDILLLGNSVTMLKEVKSWLSKNPGEIHWIAIKTILKYLRNTKDMVPVYGVKPKDELKVTCYADASFQTDKDDTKSQTGYVFVLNGGAVDWKSAKQITTAMYSIEAKYIATAEASMEAVWMKKFIDGLGGVMPSNKRPMEMLCDNESALAIASYLKILKGAKHF